MAMQALPLHTGHTQTAPAQGDRRSVRVCHRCTVPPAIDITPTQRRLQWHSSSNSNNNHPTVVYLRAVHFLNRHRRTRWLRQRRQLQRPPPRVIPLACHPTVPPWPLHFRPLICTTRTWLLVSSPVALVRRFLRERSEDSSQVTPIATLQKLPFPKTPYHRLLLSDAHQDHTEKASRVSVL